MSSAIDLYYLTPGDAAVVDDTGTSRLLVRLRHEQFVIIQSNLWGGGVRADVAGHVGWVEQFVIISPKQPLGRGGVRADVTRHVGWVGLTGSTAEASTTGPRARTSHRRKRAG
jgi:hypothetical protein